MLTGIAGEPRDRVQGRGFRLEQNFPNPFNQSTTINYQLQKPELVSLKVYNITGQLIKTLDDGYRIAGDHAIKWDGKDESGKRVTTGLYFYRLNTANVSEVKRLLLVK